MFKLTFICLTMAILSNATLVKAQNTSLQEGTLPFREIVEYPDEYSPGNVIARMIDGIGFRYYWATEGLRTADLIYKPSNNARSSGETLGHILMMSATILNVAEQKPILARNNLKGLNFKAKREATLSNLKKARDLFAGLSAEEVAERQMVFESSDGVQNIVPLWNMVNGQVLDISWHLGQIVSFRRATGNPFNNNASLFRGACYSVKANVIRANSQQHCRDQVAMTMLLLHQFNTWRQFFIYSTCYQN